MVGGGALGFFVLAAQGHSREWLPSFFAKLHFFCDFDVAVCNTIWLFVPLRLKNIFKSVFEEGTGPLALQWPIFGSRSVPPLQ